MNITFLGTELAPHLIDDHDVTVWNRTTDRTQTLADAGARVPYRANRTPAAATTTSRR
jgi:3-hydroxyisobutyrate dehydrogenase